MTEFTEQAITIAFWSGLTLASFFVPLWLIFDSDEKAGTAK